MRVADAAPRPILSPAEPLPVPLIAIFCGAPCCVILLGAVGGLESAPLSLAQLPTGITSTNLAGIGIAVLSSVNIVGGGTIGSATAGGSQVTSSGALFTNQVSTGSMSIGDVDVTSNNTSGDSHKNVQPTMIVNYILRII